MFDIIEIVDPGTPYEAEGYVGTYATREEAEAAAAAFQSEADGLAVHFDVVEAE